MCRTERQLGSRVLEYIAVCVEKQLKGRISGNCALPRNQKQADIFHSRPFDNDQSRGSQGELIYDHPYTAWPGGKLISVLRY